VVSPPYLYRELNLLDQVYACNIYCSCDIKIDKTEGLVIIARYRSLLSPSQRGDSHIRLENMLCFLLYYDCLNFAAQ
jgi:hypothetical protein